MLPVVLACHHWFRKWRSWPDGTLWATGWACGMDNQPRMDAGYATEHDQGYTSWIDTCFQQVLSARHLVALNPVVGRPFPDDDLDVEAATLARLVNRRMWDERSGFYVDRHQDGRLSSVKTIGAYWGLLAGAVPPARRTRLVGHLEDTSSFKRPHRVPSRGTRSLAPGR